MRTAAEILREFGLPPPPHGETRFYVLCPKCSAQRSSREHRASKCLGVTIGDQGVHFGCSHCGWKGGGYYRNGADDDPIVATFDYQDEQGAVLFQKVRTKRKKFWQRRPDGRGGWIKGLGKTRRVLYRLPEVIEAMASERVVLVVEGEKDVDGAWSIGVPATCNPDGASEPGQRAKWRSDYSKTLRGADIVIIPDHDDAGYAHAEAVATMSAWTAKRVRVLKLAEHWAQCPKGGDLSDWLKAGHLREELDALIEQAKAWKVPHPNNGAAFVVAPPPTGTEPMLGGMCVKIRVIPKFSDLTKDGKPCPTVANTRNALVSLQVECRYDLFHDRLLVGGHEIGQWAGELSDNACLALRRIISNYYGFDPGRNNMHDAAVQVCLRRCFDPICDYLDSLAWDGVKRLDGWLASYLSATDTPLNREIGKLALVAAVRRARKPGTKFDQIVVLEGPEGTLKSTAIELMAGQENFSDQTILGLRDLEQQERLRGKWLYEIADLSGIKRAEVEHVKAFASRTHDRARPAYGRTLKEQPRRCVFFGTTNDESYLKSSTGNRRFWPVKTGAIDIEKLRTDRNHLWAEAAHVEASGCSLVLPEKLWPQAREVQDERYTEDVWQLTIDEYCAHRKDTSVTEILREALRIDVGKWGQVEQNRVAACLRRKFERYQKRDGVDREWRYRRKSPTNQT
jgi:hypothetical protein